MASIAEIRVRINSIKKTQKITNAMYLIASTKFQKANRSLEESRSYFDGLRNDLKNVLDNMPEVDNPLFYSDSVEGTKDDVCGLLVITADKGLAGAYNVSIIKETQKILDEYENTRLFVVGEYGRNFYRTKGIPIEEDFLFSAEHTTIDSAREIAKALLDSFKEKKIDRLYVVYTEMGKGQRLITRSERLLPFQRQEKESAEKEEGFGFEIVPSPDEVLIGLIESYVNGYIYGALIESFCSEQRARMEAMDNANDNAEELLSALLLQFNRARQAAITMEITEVSAGALAQRKKREDKS